MGSIINKKGPVAQLARALPWHGRGQGFKSPRVHQNKKMLDGNDEKLVSQYLKGDEKSLEILVKQYIKPIYRFIYRYLGNTSDAEDITQEAFVKAWRHLKKFDQMKSFKTWIFSIAKNASIDFLRKKKIIPFSKFNNREDENIITETIVDPAPLPQEIFDLKNLAEELARVMKKLSPKYRMVLFLHYNDHFTFREIAESLEEPLNTVKSRHRRALIALRKLLTE